MMKILQAIMAALHIKDENEDEGYTDHMVGQKTGPYYCGTAFCGHSTKRAARECWRKKCEVVKSINAEADNLLASGKPEQAEVIRRRQDAYYPELNPDNWPINRSSYELRKEFIERAEREEKG